MTPPGRTERAAMTAPSAAELVERLDALYASTDLMDHTCAEFDSFVRDNWPAIRALLAAALAEQAQEVDGLLVHQADLVGRIAALEAELAEAKKDADRFWA